MIPRADALPPHAFTASAEPQVVGKMPAARPFNRPGVSCRRSKMPMSREKILHLPNRDLGPLVSKNKLLFQKYFSHETTSTVILLVVA
jgi:hypothetical protein